LAKGREMVTSYIIGLFMNGIYQLIVCTAWGPSSRCGAPNWCFPVATAFRNTVNLSGIRKTLDTGVGGRSPASASLSLHLAVIAILACSSSGSARPNWDRNMRAVGQDMEVARAAGIRVEETPYHLLHHQHGAGRLWE
jgi:simple sugar transport system permease protein